MHTTEELIALALKEDIGPGDITTDNIVDPRARGKGTIVAKEALVLAGVTVAGKVFGALEADLAYDACFQDGDQVAAGSVVVNLRGTLANLLKGERTAKLPP